MKCKNIKQQTSLVGDKNPNWRGGKYPYHNNGDFKRKAHFLLEKYKKCSLCDNKSYLVHHKDFSKTNHDINNLQPLCRACHTKIHTDDRCRKGKIYKKYGMKMSDIQKLIPFDLSYLYDLHHEGKLETMLAKVLT
jgi:hypothetical protein